MAQRRKSDSIGVHGRVLCHGVCAAVLATAAIGMLTAPATATFITLSDWSSHDGQAPAGTLDATLDFQVVLTTLTFTVTNTSNSNPDPLDLWNVSNFYFNVSDNVTGLILSGAPTGWSLAPSDWTGPGDVNSTTQADGFGVFDWVLRYDLDNNPQSGLLDPGEILAFTMTISGAGPFDMGDFGTELSIDPVDDDPARLSHAVAKFRGVQGGNFNNASGFGAASPAPGTLALLGLGGLLGLGRRRRPT